jgi:substrate-binding family protein
MVAGSPSRPRKIGALRLSPTVLALALVAVACSSTSAPRSSNVTVQQTASPAGPEAGANQGAPSPALPQGTSPALAGSKQPGSRPAPQPTVRVSDLGPPGQGVGRNKIKVGFWILDVSAACEGTGVRVATCADDDRGETEAINNYINKHGGIARRAIDPVIIKSAIDRSHAAQAQAACESFAVDHKVFAVLVPPQPARIQLATCLAKRGVPVIDAGMWPYDRVDYQKVAGYYFQPDRPRPERWVRAYIDGLAAQGFFKGDTRIGLVRWSAPAFERVTERVLKVRLAARGLRLLEEAAISPPDSLSGYGGMNAQINSAILRFSNSRVNRVLFFADIGEVQTFWFPAAESQNFRPRYGLTSTDTPGQSLEDLAPHEQLRGAMGVGWNPIFDVGPEVDPGGSRAAELCKKILRDAGQDAGAGRNLKCDNAFFLKAVLDRAPALNVKGMRIAVENLGDRFLPSGTFATRFGPGRWDGPSLYRYLAFDFAGCECFKYTSGPKTLP